MKTRKTMFELLRAYHKKHGGYSVTVILSELLWNNSYVVMELETSDGTECGRVRVPRTMHTYRLKSARGRCNIRRLAGYGAWIMRRWDIREMLTRVTFNPLRDYAALHMTEWEVFGK